jgi:hypothetical protein
LQAHLPELEMTLDQIAETVWNLRQALTGSLTEAVIEHAHRFEFMRKEMVCKTCQRILTAQPLVSSPVETMLGQVRLERPYFYCLVCQAGSYPLDGALGLMPGAPSSMCKRRRPGWSSKRLTTKPRASFTI